MRIRPGARTTRAFSLAVAAAMMVALPAGVADAAPAPQVPTADATASPSPAKADAQTLRIATSGFVDSFNPFTSIYLLPTNAIRYMYEYLVQNSAVDGSPTAGLAAEWKAEDGGKKWVYTLHDGMKWSDGQPITSADVVYTYRQMMTVPALGTANGNLVSNFAAVDAPDDKTVVVTLKTPQAPNPGSEIPIVPKHVWEKVSDPATFANDSDVVGSGPFTLVSYKANQSIVLKANPNFWRGAPKIDRLQYIYYTNSDAQVQALRSGDVDLVTALSPTQFDALKGVDGITTHSGEGRRYTSLSLNPGFKTRDGKPFGTANPALADVAVRQAIRLGTDTDTLLKKVLDGKGVLATSFIPASFPKWHLADDDPAIVTFDPAAAKAKLDADGWKPGPDGIRVKDGKKLQLRMMVDADDLTEQSAAEYFAPWMKNIGIAIDVQSTDSDTISAKSTKGDYDIYFTGWSVNPDPDYQLGINTCMNLPTNTDGTGGTSQDGYCNPKFDALYNQQRSELDETKRQGIVRDMLRMNYADTAQVATWYANSLEAYRSDRFTGFTLQPEKTGIIANQAGYWGYLTVHAVGASDQAGSGANVGLIVVGGIVVVIVIGGVIFFLMRRRRMADVE